MKPKHRGVISIFSIELQMLECSYGVVEGTNTRTRLYNPNLD